MFKFRRIVKKSGFTLVELIVTIAIFAVIAAILVPTLFGFTLSARITSANRTASELKKSIAYFLTKADAYSKNYMRIAEGNREVFTVTIVGGIWTINAVEHPDAFSPDTVEWGSTAVIRPETTVSSTSYGEELLGIHLRDTFPELKNGVFRANCVQGVCLSVWFSPDMNDIEVLDKLPEFGETSAWVDDSGTYTRVYEWDGKTAGVNADGYVIGTAPILDLATVTG